MCIRDSVAVDLALGDVGAVLCHQPLPDAAGGVALLARRLLVGRQPLVDHRLERVEFRRRPVSRRSLGRRHRRVERLADSTAMNAVAFYQLPDRQALPQMIAPDLLELFHSCHSLPTSPSLSIERSASVAVRTEVGPVQASTVGPVEISTPRNLFRIKYVTTDAFDAG